ALLFLGAGAVIHGMGDEQDMMKMGGLRKKMPLTWITMGIATLSIAGIPPLAGFWSKDEILAVLFERGGYFTVLWAVGILTALLTAFYMGRQYFLVFEGKARWDEGVDPHESPRVMTRPLVILAVLTILVGLINTPFRLSFEHFLEPAFESVTIAQGPQSAGSITLLAVVSVLAGVAGLVMAYLLYGRADEMTRQRMLGWVRRPMFVWENAYWVDRVYGRLVVAPGKRVAVWMAEFVDQVVIDGLVNGVGGSVRRIGGWIRPLQTGFVRSYGVLLAGGTVALVAWIISRGI
ncbi:MAG TPA: NADH-quinone oxidoreductase subunit L, partial [Actinobacteria bacterium]|nr:NADH-quinone oxidoreductase subunit L [Actinomycetota bacterium]